MTRSDSCGERRRSALRRCNGESPRHRLKRFVDLASQMFELTKRKAFTYAVNHLRWREVGLFSRECHRAFRAVFPMRVFANNVSLLFVFRRFAHLNTLNDSNGPVKLLEHGHSTPAPNETKLSHRSRHRAVLRISMLKLSCANLRARQRFAGALG